MEGLPLLQGFVIAHVGLADASSSGDILYDQGGRLLDDENPTMEACLAIYGRSDFVNFMECTSNARELADWDVYAGRNFMASSVSLS